MQLTQKHMERRTVDYDSIIITNYNSGDSWKIMSTSDMKIVAGTAGMPAEP